MVFVDLEKGVRSSANGALMMKPMKEMSFGTGSLHQDRTRYLDADRNDNDRSAGISMLKGVGIMDQQSASSSSSSSWMTGDTHRED